MTTLRHAMWMGATGTLGLTLALASCNGGSNGPDPTTPAPTLTAVAPPLGPTSGTTTLTLTGTNFTSGTTVQIGTAMATGVAFVSATQLTAVLPAQPMGNRSRPPADGWPAPTAVPADARSGS